MMTLYHGTTHDFTEIDVKLGNPYKDFGQGFYVTETRAQAVCMARRNYEILKSRYARRNMDGGALKRYVYEYAIAESDMK